MKYVICLLTIICLIASSACAESAAIAENIFLISPGLSWNSSIEQINSMLAVTEKEENAFGGTLFTYGHSPVKALNRYADVKILSNKNGEPIMVSASVILTKSLLSLFQSSASDSVWALAEETLGSTYSDKGRILFSDPSGISSFDAAAFTQEEADFILSLSGLAKDINTLRHAKGWSVDQTFGASALFFANENEEFELLLTFVHYKRMNEYLSNAASALSASSVSDQTPRFLLPGGIQWSDSRNSVTEKTASHYYAEDEYAVYAIYEKDAFFGGYTAYANFFFEEDQLICASYFVEDMFDLSYQNICSILTSDVGNALALNDVFSVGYARSFSPSIDRAGIWITESTEITCAYDPADKRTYVFLISRIPD